MLLHHTVEIKTFNFEKEVLPMLETYCFDCHDSATAKGDIDLESALAQKPLVRNRLLWENVAERVKMGALRRARSGGMRQQRPTTTAAPRAASAA